MTLARMKWFSVLTFHFILLDIALALAIAGNNVESKQQDDSAASKTTTTIPTTTIIATTEAPKKAAEAGEQQKTTSKNAENIEKPLPKKRGALEDLYHGQSLNSDENGFGSNDEPNPEELFTGSRSEVDERPFYGYNEPDSAFLNDVGYFENDGRKKRTVKAEGLYNRPQEYSNPEIELTPEDVAALLRYLEERRLLSHQVHSSWSDYDNTIDSIEADMRDEDIYRDRPETRFEDPYDGNLDNFDRYPTGIKRYMISRRRRSDFSGNPKLKIPVFRRAIL